MGENTKIEWATHSFKPWRVSNETRVVAAESMWRKPVKWDREAEEDMIAASDYNHRFCGCDDFVPVEPQSPRVLLLADVFEDWQGPIQNSYGDTMMICPNGHIDSWVWGAAPKQIDCSHSCGADTRPMTMADLRARLFRMIDATPNLDWILVTKRPENILRMWRENSLERTAELWGKIGGRNALLFRHNVWLLTSVEDQASANKRIPELLKCRDLCPVLGLSMEPLLGPVDLHLRAWQDIHGENGIDWTIAGGESGPGARPMHPDWVRSIRDQCDAAGVPFFFKQWGEWMPTFHGIDPSVGDPHCRIHGVHHFDGNQSMWMVGKKAAGRLLDGRTWDQFPEVGA